MSVIRKQTWKTFCYLYHQRVPWTTLMFIKKRQANISGMGKKDKKDNIPKKVSLWRNLQYSLYILLLLDKSDLSFKSIWNMYFPIMLKYVVYIQWNNLVARFDISNWHVGSNSAFKPRHTTFIKLMGATPAASTTKSGQQFPQSNFCIWHKYWNSMFAKSLIYTGLQFIALKKRQQQQSTVCILIFYLML